MPRLRWAILVAASGAISTRSFFGVAPDDLGELLDRVEVQMFAHLEAVAKRGRQQARPRGGADQREGLQVDGDRVGVDPFAQGYVDAEVFHGRVEEFLDRLGEPVDLVDKEHRPLFDVGQVGDEVLGGRQGRPAGHEEVHVQVVRDAGGEGRLAQPWRAVEEDMAQRLAPLAGRIDGDLQPGKDLALADHVPHPLRPHSRSSSTRFVCGCRIGSRAIVAGSGGKGWAVA